MKAQKVVEFLKLYWPKISQFFGFKNFLKDDEAKFRLWTGFKVTFIPFMTLFVLWIFLWIFLRINLAFYEVNGFPSSVDLSEAYFAYILSTLSNLTPFLIGFALALWIAGLYMAEVLLRPFKLIGDYCEKVTNGEPAIYDPDFFTDLKLLTRFSEYFFNILENASKNKKLLQFDVPVKFTRIHGPVFETNFFLQFFMMTIVTSMIVAGAIYIIIADIHQDMVKLSIEYLRHSKGVSYFLAQQQDILNILIIGTLIVHTILYITLSVNLYSKVAIPAFGIFATMRSFLKGSLEARVHLIGHPYIRPHCRKFNKYLDKIVRDLTKT
ncbi:MAG: hypothetical protein A2X86_14275 [Bdellovibrionales bacterium GWA2_49_15]|nr:MAG: hypothetical protein A2X86_14275 [Bdellovibrionales bacterium GWA2_49_15]HAZ14070.1 hypothetical protein [Bdellovibrionales bacterium]